MPATTLDLYIANWSLLLQGWSVNGRLSSAAQEAMLLDGQPSLLTALIEQWSKGDFSGLPPIVLLPASSMPGAAGAYAKSTGTIYINEDWLQIASQAQVLSVFTQELGHHLDALLNSSDTDGDEGALFAALLENKNLSAQGIETYRNIDDRGMILVNGDWVEVETEGLAQIDTPRLLKDINPGINGSDPWQFTQAGNTLYFVARDDSKGSQLWKTDGTTTGTTALTDVLVYRYGHPNFMGFDPGALTPAGNLLFFTASDDDYGRELWMTDGSKEGTKRVTDIMPGKDGSNPDALTVIGDTIFYSAFHKDFGRELWKTNISTGQTQIVKDIRPGIESGIGYYLKAVGNTLFFTADNGVNGLELWKHEVNTNITSMVRDIHPDPGFAGRLAAPRHLTAVGNQLFFTADNGLSGRELWRSDGTEQGARIVRDVNPGDASSNPYILLVVGNTLYFSAINNSTGRELWRYNSITGTIEHSPVADIAPGKASSNPSYLTQVGNAIYFIANDGSSGAKLWKTELGTGYTSKVSQSSLPVNWAITSDLKPVGNALYFSANDGNSNELWKYVIDSGITERVSNISPGNQGWTIRYLTNFKDTLFFSAYDNDKGWEPWILGGNHLGTLNEHLSSSAFRLNPGESKSFEITLPPGKLQPGKFSIDSYDLFFKTSGGGTEIKSYNENVDTDWEKENFTPGSTVRVEVRNTSGSIINTSLDAYLWKINGSVYDFIEGSKKVAIKKLHKDFTESNFEDTWVVTHGWKGNVDDGGRFHQLATEISEQNGQAVLLDWSEPADYPGETILGVNLTPITEPRKAASWINDIAAFATHSLANTWGYRSNLNLVGHSLGAYLSSEIARLISENPATAGYKVDRLIALDPADWLSNPYNLNNNKQDPASVVGAVEVINAKPFNEVSKYSLAFWGDLLLGNGTGKDISARTATHSIEVGFKDQSDAGLNHGYIVDLYKNLIDTQRVQHKIKDYFSLREESPFAYNPDKDEARIGMVDSLGFLDFGVTYMLVGEYDEYTNVPPPSLPQSFSFDLGPKLVLPSGGIGYKYILVSDGYLSGGSLFVTVHGVCRPDLDMT